MSARPSSSREPIGCPKQWGDLRPDDGARRYCDSCRKHVHNLSAMSRAEAERLVSRETAGGLCVAFLRDGRGGIQFREPAWRRTMRRVGLFVLGLVSILPWSGASAADAPATAADKPKTASKRKCPPVADAKDMKNMILGDDGIFVEVRNLKPEQQGSKVR